jgi:hypothetical protein
MPFAHQAVAGLSSDGIVPTQIVMVRIAAVSDIMDVSLGDLRPSPFSDPAGRALVSRLIVENEMVVALLEADTNVDGAPASFH